MRKLVTMIAATVLIPGTALPGATPAVAGGVPSPSWQFSQTATTHRLVIADVVDRSVVWAVGGGRVPADGSVVRTTDGGRSWQDVTPPGGATEVFRDVEASDRDHAVVLAAGSPSRFYRTADGGTTWAIVFEDVTPDAYYNCTAFFDQRHGLAMSDPVGGRFRLAGTSDGGRSWHLLTPSVMPPALAGEYGLATGTCLQANGRNAWFGTTTPAGIGNRVFSTHDRGNSWTVAGTPMPGGDNTGIRSLSFRDFRHGLAVGGELPPPNGTDLGAAVVSPDGGRTWAAAGPPTGFRNGVSWIPSLRRTVVAVGIGSDISTDGGQTWRRFDDTELLGIDCRPGAGCWAVGAGGLAARLSIAKH
jgi:photosystem II stability/assembly factor-like uncharacterized protein